MPTSKREPSKIYDLGQNRVHALAELSLKIQAGEFIALCGASGSGKSTLLNLLGGLDTASSGEILIDGHNISQMTPAQLDRFRATHLGFVFQSFNLIPVLSALENIEYPLLKLNLPPNERRALSLAALESVGLENHAQHRPAQLSGGQRQRVAIARAFVHRPKLIIADEPTANLDRKTSAEVLQVLGRLNRQFGATVIVATHDPMVMRKAQRRIFISDGQLSDEQNQTSIFHSRLPDEAGDFLHARNKRRHFALLGGGARTSGARNEHLGAQLGALPTPS